MAATLGNECHEYTVVHNAQLNATVPSLSRLATTWKQDMVRALSLWIAINPANRTRPYGYVSWLNECYRLATVTSCVRCECR